ncbi:MAG: hypothetical protein JST84_29590 [Acidobacteria bacterium]|nr:hypothetical protein [Acidobacteriota bacterium]
MTEFYPVYLQTQAELEHHFSALPLLSYLALDIETANWWKPQEEQIAMLQLAYRDLQGNIQVLLLDAQGMQSWQPVQLLLEDATVPIAIHNASFDAIKLRQHFRIHAYPIHDTMRAARRAGARRYSLAALVQQHFGVELDKAEQQSDWSRRPFTASQLRYAAKDAGYTLLLYEQQRELGLSGSYTLPAQTEMPLLAAPPQIAEAPAAVDTVDLSLPEGISLIGLAALGLVAKKPHYYSPSALVVAIGNERSGLAGWIVRAFLGEDADIEEADAQLSIANLMAQGVMTLDSFRRCEITPAGDELWQRCKTAARL